MHPRPILLAVVFVAISHLPALAQPVETKVFRLLAIAPESVTGLFYDAGSQNEAVIAPVSCPSPAYALPESETLHLYKITPAASPDAAPIKISYADVGLQGSPPYLVILKPPGKNSRQPCAAQCLSFTRGAQPANSSQFFNLSSHLTAVVYGSEKFLLKPGQSRIVPFTSPKARGETIPYKLGVSNADNSWTLVESLDVFKEAGARQIIFLIDDINPSTGRPSFKSVMITDWFSPPPSPK